MTKKVLAFGSFDSLHPGHQHFLAAAKTLGDYLIAAVAPDSVIQNIKGRPPRFKAAQRLQALKDSHLADSVVLSDEATGSWQIIKRERPAIIAIGHDQDALRASLEEYLDASYPEVETEEGWQTNQKKPTIITIDYYPVQKHD